MGSDGVVRVAAANLCGRYIKLVQQRPKKKPGKKREFQAKAQGLCKRFATKTKVVQKEERHENDSEIKQNKKIAFMFRFRQNYTHYLKQNRL